MKSNRTPRPTPTAETARLVRAWRQARRRMDRAEDRMYEAQDRLEKALDKARAEWVEAQHALAAHLRNDLRIPPESPMRGVDVGIVAGRHLLQWTDTTFDGNNKRVPIPGPLNLRIHTIKVRGVVPDDEPAE
jgi:hypothetical protein